MIGGTHGKILHVDLTSGKHCDRAARATISTGCWSAGGRWSPTCCCATCPPGTDPLSPDNLLIFAPGIMQGTNFPGAGRHGVGGKSPLTGALGSSEVGGWWGHEFKRAGFDALVIRGRAESPVYLWIKDGEVEIRPADHLWGQLTAPDRGRHPRRVGRRAGARGPDRPGRREPGALCGRHARRQPGGRAQRPGRADGLQEPQGGGRARHDARFPWPTERG